MKKLLLVSFFFTTFLNAQNEPDLLFVNKEQNIGYGGAINTTNSAKDNFGNIYLVGTFSNMADFDPTAAEANLTAVSFSDLFIAVYDSNGNYLGARSIGGTGAITRTSIVIDSGFIYLTGNYTNTIDFDPSANVSNLTTTNAGGAGFLAKYDLNGNLITCKSIDGTGTVKINDIKFFNSQLIIVGSLTGTIDFDPSATTLNLTQTGATTGGFVAKYNNSLLVQTAFNFASTGSINTSSLAVASTGDMVISGTYTGTADFDPSSLTAILISGGFSKTFIAKYSDSGLVLWVKDIGGSNSSTSTTNNPKLVLDSGSNILITGAFSFTSDFDPSAAVVSFTTSGSSDVFMAKYDSGGSYIWAKKIGGTVADQVSAIVIDAANNIHINGTFSGIVDFDPNAGILNLDSTSGTNFFAKYDGNGTSIYANNLNTSITSILVDNSNNLVVSGTFTGTRDFDTSAATANLISLSTNVFLAKYATNGGYIFAKPIGDKLSNRIISYISTDQAGSVYRVGQLSATTDLDPSSAVFNLSSPSGLGIFIAKYSTNGTFVWGNKIDGGVGSTVGVSVTNTDANGNTYIVGGFFGTVDFDPSANSANMISSSTTVSDLFIAKYDSNGNYLWAKQISGSIGARKKLVFDASGNFYFSGTFSGTNPIDVDPSPSNVFNLTPNGLSSSNSYFIKFNPQGDFIWAKSINAENTGHFISITQFDIKDSSLYITGRFLGTADFNPSTTVINNLTTIIESSNETFFAKYDLNGDYQFAIKFDNDPTTGFINKGSSFDIDSNGDIFLLSLFVYTVDFDASPTATFNLTAIPDSGGYNLAILKYTSNGSFVWAKQIVPLDIDSFFPNTNSIQGNEWLSSSYIKDNELIITSTAYGNFDFDPSANNLILNSTVNSDGDFNASIFIAKYNKANGDVVSANRLEGNYTAEIFNTCVDNNQNLLMSGSFIGTVDFDFTSAVQNLTSVSPYNSDRFWAKYENQTLGLEENSISKGYVIYPNPTNSFLYVMHSYYDEFSVTLLDITGKVLQKELLTNQKGIDVSAYPQGMYFIQVENGLEKSTLKFSKK